MIVSIYVALLPLAIGNVRVLLQLELYILISLDTLHWVAGRQRDVCRPIFNFAR